MSQNIENWPKFDIDPIPLTKVSWEDVYFYAIKYTDKPTKEDLEYIMNYVVRKFDCEHSTYWDHINEACRVYYKELKDDD